MEQNLKQRVVGALVLISLAVIFLPLVFDGQQQRIDTERYRIPEKPAIVIAAPDIQPLERAAREQYEAIARIAEEQASQDAESELFDHSQPDAVDMPVSQAEDAGVAQRTPSPATQQHIEQEKQLDATLQNQSVTTTVPLADAWVIQVGAFSSQANANGLQNRLKTDGYTAFVKSSRSGSTVLHKVYVGPEIRRAQLDQQKIELERKYNLKALILKYIP